MARASASKGTVRAAGGVVWRIDGGGVVEVLMVHRPRYDDWTFPKGKAEPGETDDHTALREVEEETGLRCLLGHELEPTTYVDHKGRTKVVRYWEMRVIDGRFEPNDEVDRVEWVTPDEAAQRLTYERDQPLVCSFTRFAGLD